MLKREKRTETSEETINKVWHSERIEKSDSFSLYSSVERNKEKKTVGGEEIEKKKLVGLIVAYAKFEYILSTSTNCICPTSAVSIDYISS